MPFDSLFMVAIQSSLVLGLIHGINPCGHSWLILVPFTLGVQSGKQVALRTLSFITGTGVACLALGASLGAISSFIPPHFQLYVEVATAVILIGLGLVLIIKPTLLHHHDHQHQEEHHHCDCTSNASQSKCHNTTLMALFGVGFFNMIIPCPTVAIMYGYALESGNVLNATLVFAAYAVTTGITVSLVIYSIYRISTLLKTLQQDWIETAIMRTAGALTILFSTISLYHL